MVLSFDRCVEVTNYKTTFYVFSPQKGNQEIISLILFGFKPFANDIHTELLVPEGEIFGLSRSFAAE